MCLSQAMFAGSHWLTHLGPGNTPVPTYPWIQLKWHKTVTVKGDSQHKVTYNRWITFCKSKLCAVTSIAVSTVRAKWRKRWDTKRGKHEAVRALVAELLRDRQHSKFGEELSRRNAIYKRTHHWCRPSAGSNCSEQKLFFKGNSHTSEGKKANTHAWSCVNSCSSSTLCVKRILIFSTDQATHFNSLDILSKRLTFKKDSVSSIKMSAVVPGT